MSSRFTARQRFKALFNHDVILTADIGPAEIACGKYDFDVVGFYARPDVFRLHVNEKPTPPVVAD